jgi:hypothetical protein
LPALRFSGTPGTDGKVLEINDVGAAFVCVNLDLH